MSQLSAILSPLIQGFMNNALKSLNKTETLDNGGQVVEKQNSSKEEINKLKFADLQIEKPEETSSLQQTKDLHEADKKSSKEKDTENNSENNSINNEKNDNPKFGILKTLSKPLAALGVIAACFSSKNLSKFFWLFVAGASYFGGKILGVQEGIFKGLKHGLKFDGSIDSITSRFKDLQGIVQSKKTTDSDLHEAKNIDLDKDIFWNYEDKKVLMRSLKEFLAKSKFESNNQAKDEAGTTRGDLLVLTGPPGVAKTMIAEGIAKLAGRKLVKTGIREEKFISDIIANLKNKFEEAHKNNAYIFIDEADGIIRSRADKVDDKSGWNHSITTITTSILQLLDEYKQKGVKVILATNDGVSLDPAIFERGIQAPISFPDLEQRKGILEKKLEKYLNEKSVTKLKSQLYFDQELNEIAQKHKVSGRIIDAAVKRSLFITEENEKDRIDPDTNEPPYKLKYLDEAFTEIKSSNKKSKRSDLIERSPILPFSF